MKGIIWLASYPKSGNTWLRALLTNFLRPAAQPASIDKLIGLPLTRSRDFLEQWLGFSTTDLSLAETERWLPRVYTAMAETPEPWFIKTHEHLAPPGADFRRATAAAIYLVRDPRDVAVSFSHHESRDLDAIIAAMADPDHILGNVPHGIWHRLPERLGTWSSHVESWLDSGLHPLVVRYEDLLAAPELWFGKILRHCGHEPAPARLRQAVAHADFRELSSQEQTHGYASRPARMTAFFREGVAGGWRSTLTPAQAACIVHAHGAVMTRCGYSLE